MMYRKEVWLSYITDHFKDEINFVFAEQREQISEVLLNFHDIAFLEIQWLRFSLQGLFHASRPSLPQWKNLSVNL